MSRNQLSLRERLRSGEFVLGTFAEIASPSLVEILAHAGFDFVIIDREHGSIDLETAENMIRAAQATGIAPIVRVAENHPVLIRQPLDMGAIGVQVPQVGTSEAASQVVQASMFAPQGERGLQPFVRGARFGAIPTADLMQQANEETVLAIHIEGKEGVANLDQILKVDRIDVIFIGPYDLSQSLGIPGQTSHPRVEELIHEIASKSRAAVKCVGIYCPNPAAVAKWRAIGITYAALSMDGMIFLQACRDLVNQVREKI